MPFDFDGFVETFKLEGDYYGRFPGLNGSGPSVLKLDGKNIENIRQHNLFDTNVR
jgi:hypothetical protein